jgi:hypothetical protein
MLPGIEQLVRSDKTGQAGTCDHYVGLVTIIIAHD